MLTNKCKTQTLSPMPSIVKSLVAVGLFVCFSIPAFSQDNFREGFIIQPTGDTLRGLVNYRKGWRNFKVCEFRSTSDGVTTEFTPQQIRGYGFTGDDVFESRLLETDSVFLEVLVRGEASLYRYIDAYWLQMQSAGLVQIKNEKVRKYVDGQLIGEYSNQHVATLTMMFKDCDEVRNSMNRVSFTEKSLTRAVQRYNTCKGSTSHILNTKPWINANFGISVGLNISNLRFKSKLEDFRSLTKPSPRATSFLPAAMVEIGSPRVSERFKVVVSIMYLHTNYELYDKWKHGLSTIRDYTEFDVKQLKIPVGIRYTFPGKRITPFLTAGFSYGHNFSLDKSSVRYLEQSGTVSKRDTPAPDFLKAKFQVGVWGGVGMLTPVSKKLVAWLEFRSERTTGLSRTNNGTLQSKVVNYQIILGIIRTKK